VELIHYAGNTILTGDAIAHSLLGYAQALAAKGSSDTVTIPVWHTDGSVRSAEILIGPASQLIAEPYDTDAPELVDEDAVNRLDTAAARTRAPHAVPEAVVDHTAADASDLDLPPDAFA
jgi:hypothetical protein